ncbi:MAG: trehalase family glycosidase [Flavihumibacter sp.]
MKVFLRHTGSRLLFFLLLAAGIQKKAVAQDPWSDAFTNLLDGRWKAVDSADVNTVLFSDAGAWHAYALPAEARDQGGFTGPLVMDMQGEWLANRFAQLLLEENGKRLQPDTARTKLLYHPGLLEQWLYYPGWELHLQLAFANDRQSVIRARVKNTGSSARQLRLHWQGELLGKTAGMQPYPSGIRVNLPGSARQFRIDLPAGKWKIKTSGNQYRAATDPFPVKPGAAFSTWQCQSFFPDSNLAARYRKLPDPEIVWPQVKARWQQYLSAYFAAAQQKGRRLSAAEQKLAVKCIMTLMANRRSASRDLLHESVFPSVSYQGFYGAWSWDNWKHAAALADIDTALAINSLRCLFDYQDSTGMIPDCIYADKTENNWRNTKAPLAAWALWQIYEKTGSKQLLQAFYSKMQAYHEWWYRYRDHDGNGLCEFGSTDGTRLAAAWESGMDNAVRFDSARMLANGHGAWSLNQESVDLNSFLYLEKLYLARIAGALNLPKDAEQWRAGAAAVKTAINRSFYGGTPAFYYDRRLSTGELIAVPGPEGWAPVWAQIAAAEQAASVKKLLMDDRYFFTPVPLPTLNRSDPAFDPLNGYWRGPVWLDQVYFAAAGLQAYGFRGAADTIKQKLLTTANGLLGNGPVFENYHPLTGEGLNAPNFSWSAAMLLLLIKEF